MLNNKGIIRFLGQFTSRTDKLYVTINIKGIRKEIDYYEKALEKWTVATIWQQQ